MNYFKPFGKLFYNNQFFVTKQETQAARPCVIKFTETKFTKIKIPQYVLVRQDFFCYEP